MFMMTDEKRRPKQGLHTRTQQMPVIREGIERFREAYTSGKTIILPEIPTQKTIFRFRMRALWDWFRLTAMLSAYITVLMAGGIFVTRAIIFLWEEVLGEYFGK